MLAQVDADGAALRAAATDLDKPVPTCPGWTVRDAVEHTAVAPAIQGRRCGPGMSPSRPSASGFADVANDGIDEFVERMLCFDTESYAEAAGAGQRVVIATGSSGWTVTLGPDAATFTRDAASDADARLEGHADAVLLALWNRLTYGAVGTSGDTSALAALRAAAVATTQ